MAGAYREDRSAARERLRVVERELVEQRSEIARLEAARQPVVTVDELESERGDRNMVIAVGAVFGFMGGLVLGGGMYLSHVIGGWSALLVAFACTVGFGYAQLHGASPRGVAPYVPPVHLPGPPTADENDTRARIEALEEEEKTIRALLGPSDP